MVEFITIFCTVFGTIIAYQTFKKSQVDDVEEARKFLLEKFDFLKRLNGELIAELTTYCEAQDKWDMIFLQGLTFRQSVNLLAKVKYELLNDENLEALSLTPSKLRIDKITQELETQIKHHSEFKTYIEFYLV